VTGKVVGGENFAYKGSRVGHDLDISIHGKLWSILQGGSSGESGLKRGETSVEMGVGSGHYLEWGRTGSSRLIERVAMGQPGLMGEEG
jgi:hypothetical protein